MNVTHIYRGISRYFSLFLGIFALATCSTETPPVPSPTVLDSSPTISALPTSSITTTLTPTRPIYQLDTPVGENLIDQLNFLLETNGNCAYPCWWGLHPGSTTWSAADGYLEALGYSLDDRGISPESSDLKLFFGDFIYPPVENGLLSTVYDLVFYVQQSTELIIMMKTFIDIDLATILESTGIPDDIFLTVQTYDIGSAPMYYTLSLYYEDGILISVHDEYEFDMQNNILICPQSEKRRDLFAFFWDPMYLNGFFNVLPFATPGATPDDEFLSLENITEIPPESFYQMITDPSANHCIPISSDVFFH